MPQERMQNSLGSGVIVTADGIVVTNTHVVKIGGAAEIRVALADRREFDAKVILQDEKSDIAVLRIEGGDGRFPYLEFENSDSVEVGDLVLAIGNPFGVGQTVTSGIISALARTRGRRNSEAQVFIQTDAAINPGNSGGALVDMAGTVVGINTAIFSRSGGSHGVGFAIPSNLVKLIVDSAVAGRKLERPWLGAKLDAVTREMAEALGLPASPGALVTRLYDKSPAAEAGLQAGDVIVGVDGHEVADARAVQLPADHPRHRPALRASTSCARASARGRRWPCARPRRPARTTCATCRARIPSTARAWPTSCPASADEFGLEDAGGRRHPVSAAGSTAARIGFRPGDVIQQVGRRQDRHA